MRAPTGTNAPSSYSIYSSSLSSVTDRRANSQAANNNVLHSREHSLLGQLFSYSTSHLPISMQRFDPA